VRLAYLINQYPAPSQTFIRREIAAVEAQGLEVARFAVRRWDRPLVDPEDAAEGRRTEYLLEAGPLRILSHVVRTAAGRPGAFARALAAAVRLGRRSERGLLIHLIYLAEACLLRSRLADFGAGHVHAHFGTNAAAVALLCRVLGGPPFSFTVHGPEEFDSPRALGLGEKVRGAAFVVAISEFTRSQLLRWADPPDWPKIRVVRCGIDAPFLGGPTPPPAGSRRLVCVGRLAEQKGHLALLEAAAILAARGRGFEIAFIGDGALRGEIERRIADLGLDGRVHLLGWRDGPGVRDEILRSRALVLPSFAEGLPVVLMEALALGRPVVSTYVAGIPELVEPGVSGWLVPAGSAEALAGAVAEVLAADVDDLERMGRAGAERVARCHDATAEAAKLADLIAGCYDHTIRGTDRTPPGDDALTPLSAGRASPD